MLIQVIFIMMVIILTKTLNTLNVSLRMNYIASGVITL